MRQLILFVSTIGLTYFSLQYGFGHHNSTVLTDETMARIAQDYLTEGEVEKANKLLIDYAKSSDDAPLSYFILGNISTKKGEYVQAKVQYEKAIEQNPQLHEAYYNLALVHIRLQEYTEAKQRLEKAIELDPSNESYSKLVKKINGNTN